MISLGWLAAATHHPQGSRALTAATACFGCVLVLAYCQSVSHSILLMLALWLAVFALCSLLSTVYSMTITHKPMEKFTYGLARVPVLAVFSTTVLAQLFSIFLLKESFEHLLSPDHHGSHDAAAAHEHDSDDVGGWPYFVGAIASSIALLLSAYSLKNQPFQHVLTAASGSSIQEHAADISHAICWAVPGLARLLLPRINAMVLLASGTSLLLVLCEHFRHDFVWADPACCLVLSILIFSTMWPLSSYTGMILLQTAPLHLLNQLDRCISECSTIDGVLEVRAGHFWQLDFAQLVGTVDVRVRREADEQNVLTVVTDRLSSIISVLTVQIVKDAAWQTHEFGVPTVQSYPNLHDDHHGHSHSGGSCGEATVATSQYSSQTQRAAADAYGNATFSMTPPQYVHGHAHDQQSNGHGHSHDSHGSSHNQHGHSHDGVTYH